MKRGAKATPTALKKLAGNPGKRPLNADEPQPARGMPPCPDWMPPDGRMQWELVVPELDRMGVLTRVDVAVVEGFCALYAEMVETVKARKPLKAALLGQLRVHACELGLTPAARAKLSAPKSNDDNDTEKFFQ
jgi:phage terminase small subunit